MVWFVRIPQYAKRLQLLAAPTLAYFMVAGVTALLVLLKLFLFKVM
jgi:hypothetical protein